MRDDTKLARIREAMRMGDWDTALRIAARFQRLGIHGTTIRRAVNAAMNPSFYQQMGQDVDKLKAEGITALKQRFAKSWSTIQTSKENSGDGKRED